MNESTIMEVPDFKVLVKILVLTHERFFTFVFQSGPLFPTIPQIASRLNEPIDQIEGTITRLSKANWVVIKEILKKERVIQPTMKAWEVYSAFEIPRPESAILQSVSAKNTPDIGGLTTDDAMMIEFGIFLVEKYNVTNISNLTVDNAMLRDFGRYLVEKHGYKFSTY